MKNISEHSLRFLNLPLKLEIRIILHIANGHDITWKTRQFHYWTTWTLIQRTDGIKVAKFIFKSDFAGI